MGGSYAANHSETMLENRCLLTAILAENCVSNTKPSSMYIQYICCRFKYKKLRKLMTLSEKYYNFLLYLSYFFAIFTSVYVFDKKYATGCGYQGNQAFMSGHRRYQ